MYQVDDDVKRHNDLIQVIRAAPESINEIVTRRRKDFTREFFEHLHVVAESYHEDPATQNSIYCSYLLIFYLFMLSTAAST